MNDGNRDRQTSDVPGVSDAIADYLAKSIGVLKQHGLWDPETETLREPQRQSLPFVRAGAPSAVPAASAAPATPVSNSKSASSNFGPASALNFGRGCGIGSGSHLGSVKYPAIPASGDRSLKEPCSDLTVPHKRPSRFAQWFPKIDTANESEN